MNQDQASPPLAPSTAMAEVIEILSSDAEPTPHSSLPPPSPPLSNMSQAPTGRLSQSAHVEENLNLSNPSPIFQNSPPPSVSSPHEVESMMNILSSPTLPPTTSQPFEPVEDSEAEEEVVMKDTHEVDDSQTPLPSPMDGSTNQHIQSDDELPPLPPPSSSSPSCQIQISRGPTPTVRYLLYGGPSGIFRDANTSLLQHMQTKPNQDTPLTPLIPEPAHEARIPSVSNSILFILNYHLMLLLGI